MICHLLAAAQGLCVFKLHTRVKPMLWCTGRCPTALKPGVTVPAALQRLCPCAMLVQSELCVCVCRAALAKTNIREPRIPVISNVDAQPHSDPDTIKDILARQVCASVCFACSGHSPAYQEHAFLMCLTLHCDVAAVCRLCKHMLLLSSAKGSKEAFCLAALQCVAQVATDERCVCS